MHTFARDGLSFDVRDSGTGTRGAVVCLHGFPQDATSYDDVAARLAAAHLRVLVPDQRGYSPGARPTDRGRGAFALRELAADVVALLDAAGIEQAHLVGHDWGGALAWLVAGRYRDRLRSLTVLSTPHPAALRTAALRSTQVLRSSYLAFFQVPVLPEQLLLAGGGGLAHRVLLATGLPKDRVDHYVERLREPGALTSMLGWYRGIAASRNDSAGRTRVPTTYVFGTRDPFFSPEAARRTGEFVVAEFLPIELEAGHWLPETHADEVAEAVLARVRADRSD